MLKIPTTYYNLNLILITQIKLCFHPSFIKRHFIPWLQESQGAANWSFFTLFLKYFINVPKTSVTVLLSFNDTNPVNVVQGFTFIYTKLPKIMTQSARKEMFRKISNLEMVWNCQRVSAFQLVCFYWLKNRRKMESKMRRCLETNKKSKISEKWRHKSNKTIRIK